MTIIIILSIICMRFVVDKNPFNRITDIKNLNMFK